MEGEFRVFFSVTERSHRALGWLIFEYYACLSRSSTFRDGMRHLSRFIVLVVADLGDAYKPEPKVRQAAQPITAKLDTKGYTNSSRIRYHNNGSLLCLLPFTASVIGPVRRLMPKTAFAIRHRWTWSPNRHNPLVLRIERPSHVLYRATTSRVGALSAAHLQAGMRLHNTSFLACPDACKPRRTSRSHSGRSDGVYAGHVGFSC
jgi:hypothetical protein